MDLGLDECFTNRDIANLAASNKQIWMMLKDHPFISKLYRMFTPAFTSFAKELGIFKCRVSSPGYTLMLATKVLDEISVSDNKGPRFYMAFTLNSEDYAHNMISGPVIDNTVGFRQFPAAVFKAAIKPRRAASLTIWATVKQGVFDPVSFEWNRHFESEELPLHKLFTKQDEMCIEIDLISSKHLWFDEIRAFPATASARVICGPPL